MYKNSTDCDGPWDDGAKDNIDCDESPKAPALPRPLPLPLAAPAGLATARPAPRPRPRPVFFVSA